MIISLPGDSEEGDIILMPILAVLLLVVKENLSSSVKGRLKKQLIKFINFNSSNSLWK